jgi:signal transduction histidine kinase
VPSGRPATGDALGALAAASRALSAELRGILSSIGRDIAPLRDRDGEPGEIAASVNRHVTAAAEIVADLARLGSCPVGELPRWVDVADLLRDVVRDFAIRAARHDVRIAVEAPEDLYELVPVGALTALVHALLDNAVGASPPGTSVVVSLGSLQSGGVAGDLVLSVDDAGPPMPETARAGVLSRDFEVIAGRPSRLALIAAHAIAAHAHVPLAFDDAPGGGARARLTIPRSEPR